MPKVLIRQLTVEDASISFHWRNDSEIWKYTGQRPNIFITEEIERNWLEEKLKEKNSHRFAIISDEQYIGNIQITDIIDREKGQYHIFIGEKSFWGKGIAKLATAQIIRFANDKLKLKELFLEVNPSHSTAIKLYEKSGFIKENDEIRMSLNLLNVNPPIVSVFVMTYNHELFIEQSLEGILMQKTNFDVEIVVGEDCSTDNTRKIVLNYANKYPGKFKLLLHKQNIGALANQNAVFQSCTGKYIAFCEGDDYWTDPLKLQKQVDFLEANEDYGLVHTGCKSIINGVLKPHLEGVKIPSGFVFKELLNSGFYICALTVCVRRALVLKWSDTIDEESIKGKWKMGDYPLWLEGSLQTKFKYIPDITSFYRILPESASHSKNKRKNFEFFKSVFDIKCFFIYREGLSLDLQKPILLYYYNSLFSYSRYDIFGAIKGLLYYTKCGKLSIKIVIRFLKSLLF